MPLGLGIIMGLGHNVAASGGGGAAATAWDPVASNSNWAISGAGNTTATRTTGSGDVIVVGNQFKTSATATITITTNGTGNRVIGLADASQSNATFLGDAGSHSLGYIANDGRILFNAGLLTTVATSTVSDAIAWVANGDSTFTLKKNGSTLFTTGVLSLTSVTPACSANGTGTVFDLSGW
jgi:hypothetical protein